ncbi:MAG: hypothetical protein ACREI3_01890 [Nitrospirales bacterium]
MPVMCPKCSFEQDGGSECIRCGIIFAKYKPQPPSEPPKLKLQSGPEPAPQAQSLPPLAETPNDPAGTEEPASPNPFNRLWRFVPWLVLAGAVTVLVLIFRQAPPIAFHTDPQAADRIARKMAELQLALEAGRAATLRLNEAELNAWLQENLAIAAAHTAKNLPTGEANVQEVQSAMKDVRINLFGDQVRAYAVFDFHGKNLSLQLEGRLAVRNGQLRLEPTSGKLGSLPIPQVTLDKVVQRLFDAPDNRESFQVPPSVGTISVQNGELLVSYR